MGRQRCGWRKVCCTYKEGRRQQQWCYSMFSLPSAEKKTLQYISPSPVCWPMMFGGHTPNISYTQLVHEHSGYYTLEWGRGKLLKKGVCVFSFQAWNFLSFFLSWRGYRTLHGCITLAVPYQVLSFIKDMNILTIWWLHYVSRCREHGSCVRAINVRLWEHPRNSVLHN